MKVISFSQQGPRAICILSANGVISNVTLRQQDTLGGTVTYEVCSFHLQINIHISFCNFLALLVQYAKQIYHPHLIYELERTID